MGGVFGSPILCHKRVLSQLLSSRFHRHDLMGTQMVSENMSFNTRTCNKKQMCTNGLHKHVHTHHQTPADEQIDRTNTLHRVWLYRRQLYVIL